MAEKLWKDMELEEFVDDATRYVHSRLLEAGAKGMKLAIRDIIIDMMLRQKEEKK